MRKSPSRLELLRRALDLWATTISRWVGIGVILYETLIDHLKNPTALVVGSVLIAGAKMASALMPLADREAVERLKEHTEHEPEREQRK